MPKIKIDGEKYEVVETLPFHGAGMPAKVVKTDYGEKVVVKRFGKWTWWTVKDRF